MYVKVEYSYEQVLLPFQILGAQMLLFCDVYCRLQAISRLWQGILCLGADHKGDMLGEQQWAWLESELHHSTAAFHVIVSTVQVMGLILQAYTYIVHIW